MDNLVERLEKVKVGLQKKLESRELDEKSYWRATYDLLFKEAKVVNGPYSDNQTMRVVKKVADILMPKIPAEMHCGLRANYVLRRGNSLSSGAQKDLQDYTNLLRSTREYLEEKVFYEGMFEQALRSGIISYLKTSPSLGNVEEKRKEELHERVIGALIEHFRVRDDSERVSGYSLQQLETALEKMGNEPLSAVSSPSPNSSLKLIKG